jgi:hypothetical protein
MHLMTKGVGPTLIHMPPKTSQAKLDYIQRWRNKNREKVREQTRKSVRQNYYEKKRPWLLVQREFFNIMITDYIPETRGRKKTNTKPKRLVIVPSFT